MAMQPAASAEAASTRETAASAKAATAILVDSLLEGALHHTGKNGKTRRKKHSPSHWKSGDRLGMMRKGNQRTIPNTSGRNSARSVGMQAQICTRTHTHARGIPTGGVWNGSLVSFPHHSKSVSAFPV